jgi:sterol desaturase/sphingolipid hydroxylase (fatty acid hydroxylase superfamily)
MFTRSPSPEALWALTLLAAISLWEWAAPRHHVLVSRGVRWPTSFTLGFMNGWLLTALLTPLVVAALATGQGGGIGRALHLPTWLALALAIPVLDLVTYGQHRVLHAVPALWSFHQVHHADTEVDCTTALRFHPLEALTTGLTLACAALLLALPPPALVIHQLAALTMTVLEHANTRVPAALEASVGTLLVTPGAHRMHHTVGLEANFGTIITVWDRWFGTYRSPASEPETLPLGLDEFREAKYQTLPWVLAMPFLRARRAARLGRS